MLLELVQVTKEYGNKKHKKPVLLDFSLKVEKGEFVSVTGPSGSGKTTFLCILGALLKPSRGEVSIGGQRVDTLSEKELAQVRLEKIGFVFQFPALVPTLTVMENILLPLSLAGKPLGSHGEWAEELLERVGLSGRGDALPTQLSGGEQRRVAVARALINRPEALLADEPTGALDPETGNTLMELLQELNQKEGLTLVVVTHDPAVAARAHREVRLTKPSVQ